MADQLEMELIGLLKGIYRSSTFDEITQFWQGEMQVLYHIYESRAHAVYPSTLSDELGVTRARITSALASLRKKGLITMQVSPHDRRKLLVTLTQRGEDFVAEKEALAHRRIGALSRRLGRENLAEMVRLIVLSVQIMEDELAGEQPLKTKEQNK